MSLRAAWITDIHLDFVEDDEISRFLDTILQADPDVVFLTGDIGVAESVGGLLDRMDRVLARPIYFVLGNHDFYGNAIDSVRSEIAAISRASEHLFWMNQEMVVSLTPDTALVGHDSWPDGRLGQYATSPFELNDFYLIRDFIDANQSVRLETMQRLADEAAEHIARVLPLALKSHREVIVITHVPPFREASWYEGRISDDQSLPFFSCKSVGEVLVKVSQDQPQAMVRVLCGHTHGEGTCQVRPSLHVHTGGAIYGQPAIHSIQEIR